MRPYAGVYADSIAWLTRIHDEDFRRDLFRRFKRDFLIFDELKMLGATIDGFLERLQTVDADALAEFEWLVDKGMVSETYHLKKSKGHLLLGFEEPITGDIEAMTEQLERAGVVIVGLNDSISEVEKAKKYYWAVEETEKPEVVRAAGQRLLKVLARAGGHMARLESAAIKRIDGLDSLPILSSIEELPPSSVAKREDVISLALLQFPEPGESTPWEEILEFKERANSRGQLLALNKWMRKMANGEGSLFEIEEELESLLYEYENHMKIAKMRFGRGVFEKVIVSSAEVVENAVRLRFSKAAKLLFGLSHAKIELLKAELSAPGNEIAYIERTKRQFGRKRNT